MTAGSPAVGGVRVRLCSFHRGCQGQLRERMWGGEAQQGSGTLLLSPCHPCIHSCRSLIPPGLPACCSLGLPALVTAVSALCPAAGRAREGRERWRAEEPSPMVGSLGYSKRKCYRMESREAPPKRNGDLSSPHGNSS